MNPFKFGLIGKTPPGKLRDIFKHLTREKIKKPTLPDVFPASEAQIPEKTLTRDMFREAQERFKNAKADGGMLVKPGFGGTRQGYRSEKIQAVKRGGDKELLLRLVKKANEGFKYVKRKDLQVQAGYKRSTNITAKEIGLDTLETKLKKAFDFVMGNPDKFVSDMFDPMTQVKKLVGTNEAVGRYLKDYAPYEESRRLIKVLAAPRSKSFLQKAKGLTLGDLEFRIDNNIKGDNLFAPPKQVTAETKIMEIVDRHIKQGGKKIKWTVKPEITKGGYPSFGESRFIYNGKEYGMGELINEARDDPNFKEFFKAQRDYKTLNDKIVTHPKTGEKIRFGNLMKEVYGDSVVPYNIDHVKSIVEEPFTSLRILPARINKAAGNIIQMDEKFITNPELKGKYTKQGKEAQLKKIGYNFNQPVEDLIQAELKLADDVLNKGRVLRKPNQIVESIRKGENYVPDFYSKTAKPGPGFERQLGRLQPPAIKKQVASLGGGNCGRGLKNQGGRVGLQDGTPSVDVCFKNGLERIRKGGVDFTRAEAINFDKLTKGLRAVGASNVIKFGVLPEVLLEGALVADKMASEGDTFAQALRNSYLAVPFQAMGVAKTYEEGEKDRILAAAPESQRGRILDAFSIQDKLNKKLELIGASEGFKKQIAATDAVSDGPFGYVGDTQDLQKRLSDARENLQDLSRGDLNRAERLTTSSPLDLNIQDQLTRDAFRSAVEKADADKASRILVSPGTGFGVDAQIRKRMKDIPINIDTAKEDLKQTGDMFGIGYTPLGLNQLFPALGLQSREFGVDPVTGEYDQDRGLQDYTNYLRTLQFADTFRDEKAGGGIAKLAGVDSGPPPSSGPNSQGLQGLMKRVKKL